MLLDTQCRWANSSDALSLLEKHSFSMFCNATTPTLWKGHDARSLWHIAQPNNHYPLCGGTLGKDKQVRWEGNHLQCMAENIRLVHDYKLSFFSMARLKPGTQ